MGGSEKAPTHFFRGVEIPNCRRTQICAHRRCQSTERSIRNLFIVNQMNSRRIMCNFLAWIQRSPDNIGHWLSKNRTWVRVQRSGEFMIFIRRPRRWHSNWTLRYSRFNSFQCVFQTAHILYWCAQGNGHLTHSQRLHLPDWFFEVFSLEDLQNPMPVEKWINFIAFLFDFR